LACVDGLHGDALDGLGAQQVEIPAIDLEQHFRANLRDVLFLRTGAQLLGLDEIARAAEVRDELRGNDARREPIEDRRVVEGAGCDERAIRNAAAPVTLPRF
jgi:hypothetical protein